MKISPALSVVLPALLVSCQSGLPVPEGATVIRNGTVIDGTGAPPIADGLVIVQGGRIFGVGSKDAFRLPDNVRFVDAKASDLFVSYRIEDGSWGEALILPPEVNDGSAMLATVSPVGDFLIFGRGGDLFWVSTEVLPDPPGPSGTRPFSPGEVVSLSLDASYPEPFAYLAGVREMSDGTVLVADPMNEVLLRLDLTEGVADTIGRPGPGPQEYENPDLVLPLPGDSTLLVDLGKAQLTFVGPEGSFDGGIPMRYPAAGGRSATLQPRFADGNNWIYFEESRSAATGHPDSLSIMRMNIEDSRIESLARIWVPQPVYDRSDRYGLLPHLMEPRDDWDVGIDGRLAIVRAADFSVEWHQPDGAIRAGPSVDVQTEAIRQDHKSILLEEIKASAISGVSRSSPSGGGGEVSMRRGAPTSGGPGPRDFHWADHYPSFRFHRTLISGAHEAWVERWVPPGGPPLIQVFDADGKVAGSVTLPNNCRLLGFGSSPDGEELVYLTRTDSLGLKWLERYKVVRKTQPPDSV